jgi:hypothetical protein
VVVSLVPEWTDEAPHHAMAEGSAGDRVDLAGAVVENVIGTGGRDVLTGGAGTNRLATGGGEADELVDYGGWDDGPGGYPELPPSSDRFAGVAVNTGTVFVTDWGGTADVLDFRPLRRDDVVLNRMECDGDPERECLQVVTGTGDGQVVVIGQLGVFLDADAVGQHGTIETLLFADRKATFGGGKTGAAGERDGETPHGQAATDRQRQLAARAPRLAADALESTGAGRAAVPHAGDRRP